MRSLAFAAVVLVAACGDDGTPMEEAPRCDNENPQGVLPATGMYTDPFALELPFECIDGGLADSVGRWALVDNTQTFAFGYPKLTGSCEAGFRQHAFEDQHDPEQVVLQHTWSDGTRLYTRVGYSFPRPDPEPPFEFYSVTVACKTSADQLSARRIVFDTDRGERSFVLVGGRFAQKEPELAKGLERVGELATSSTGTPIEGLNVVVDGTYAYVVGFWGLDVVDVSDPAAPVARGHVDGDYNDVRFVRTADKAYVFLANSLDATVPVVDVTDPAAPTVAATIQEYAHSLQLAQRDGKTFLYLANYSEGVPIYDVTNPLTPTLVGIPLIPNPSPEGTAGIHDLTVDGDRIYANDTSHGFVAFDVGPDFAATVQRGSIQTSYSHASAVGTVNGRRIVLHGDEGMTPEGGAFLRILDGDPASAGFMTELARYQSRPEVGIHNLELVGNKLYISYYQDGVRVLDLTDPTQPREVAHHNTYDFENAAGGAFEGAVGVRVSNGLVHVADLSRGLLILRER